MIFRIRDSELTKANVWHDNWSGIVQAIGWHIFCWRSATQSDAARHEEIDAVRHEDTDAVRHTDISNICAKLYDRLRPVSRATLTCYR
jgi:hypothetical protein